MFLPFGAIQAFGDGLVRRWLARQDEIAPFGLNGLGDGLAGEQIVAEKDRS
jgi:hypothetical protein